MPPKKRGEWRFERTAKARSNAWSLSSISLTQHSRAHGRSVYKDIIPIAIGLAEFDQDSRQRFLAGLRHRMEWKAEQLAKAPKIREIHHLVQRLSFCSTVYQHERVFDLGLSESKCTLEPPCRFHP